MPKKPEDPKDKEIRRLRRRIKSLETQVDYLKGTIEDLLPADVEELKQMGVL